MTSARLDEFRRRVTAATQIQARVDAHGWGRNMNATVATLDGHRRAARMLLAAACEDPSDPLPEYLDSPRGARLAAAWNAAERRAAGLPA